ncbi:MAG: hypothetical protein EOS66_30230, partial [Mesorhizobium sp.]
MQLVQVGAAPHCPAGHFSPYSDGKKGHGAALAHSLPVGGWRNRWRQRPSPRIRGEDAGRQVRGSAN